MLRLICFFFLFLVEKVELNASLRESFKVEFIFLVEKVELNASFGVPFNEWGNDILAFCCKMGTISCVVSFT